MRDGRIVIRGEEARKHLLEGARAVYDSVTTTYGPKGLNVLLEKPYGRPVLTRDGVTVAKETYFTDRPKNAAAQLITEASQTTNATAGDGTSATVALTYHLIEEGFKLIAAGYNPMQIREDLLADAALIEEALSQMSTEVQDGQLKQVATVSSGDPALGQLISEAVEYVGTNGGIVTEKAHVVGVEREYVDGYYLQNGFAALTEGRREIENPYVIASSKRITSNADAIELLNHVLSLVGEDGPLRLALIGEFGGEAYNTIVTNISKGLIDAVIIPTPSVGNMGNQYLEDIAIYTGGQVLSEGDTIKAQGKAFLGRAKKVVATQSACTIFDGDYDEEEFNNRIGQLEDRTTVEENEFLLEKINDRIAKLQGKIALFRIGGATDTEKEEKEFRIEDAIQATRAALNMGVVPGGGTTLARLSTQVNSSVFRKALKTTFMKLMENAGRPAEVALNDVLSSKAPMGFNLRGEDKLVNLVKEGILDPTLVVQQVTENAASIAGNVLTIGTIIVSEDKDETKR